MGVGDVGAVPGGTGNPGHSTGGDDGGLSHTGSQWVGASPRGSAVEPEIVPVFEGADAAQRFVCILLPGERECVCI